MDKFNSSENEIDDDVDSSKSDKKRISYVSRSHKSMVEFVAVIYKNLGHAEHHKNEAIAAIHKLAAPSIKQQISSCQQYRLLEIKHGVGYKITDLFTRIYLPVNENEKRAAVIESLKSPETYQQLFRDNEFHIVPPVTGIKNHFVRNYQIKPEIAERVAEIFLENLRDYNLIDSRGVLLSGLPVKSNIPNGDTENPTENKPSESIAPPKPPTPPAPKDEDNLFELPIPLPNKRKAYLKYPLDNLTRKDIKVITKALEFIASSLDDEPE